MLQAMFSPQQPNAAPKMSEAAIVELLREIEDRLKAGEMVFAEVQWRFDQGSAPNLWIGRAMHVATAEGHGDLKYAWFSYTEYAEGSDPPDGNMLYRFPHEGLEYTSVRVRGRISDMGAIAAPQPGGKKARASPPVAMVRPPASSQGKKQISAMPTLAAFNDVRPTPVEPEPPIDVNEGEFKVPFVGHSITEEEAQSFRVFFMSSRSVSHESIQWLSSAEVVVIAKFEFGFRSDDMWNQLEEFAKNEVSRLPEDRYFFLNFLHSLFLNQLDHIGLLLDYADQLTPVYHGAMHQLQSTLTQVKYLGNDAREGRQVANYRLKQATGIPKIGMFEEQDKKVHAKLLVQTNGFRQPQGKRAKSPGGKKSSN